jgi:hypothetical protein
MAVPGRLLWRVADLGQPPDYCPIGRVKPTAARAQRAELASSQHLPRYPKQVFAYYGGAGHPA